MKHTTEKVYKKDSQLIFDSIVHSIKINSKAHPAAYLGVYQYELEGKYITAHVKDNVITFHILQEIKAPKIIGKIDLTEYEKSKSEEEELMSDYNLPMNAVLEKIDTSPSNSTREYVTCYFKVPDNLDIVEKVFNNKDLSKLLNFQNFDIQNPELAL